MKYLTTKERLSFTVSAFGRSGIFTLMSMFVLRFFTDAVGIPSIIAGYIILGGRIFDAAIDPLMGIIIDRTHSKWGKMRPYLLYSPIPIAVATILLFSAPNFETMTAKVIYASLTYILWSIAFTVQDVPFWGMSAVVTPDENERTSFISNARLGSTAGGILPTLILPIFIADNMFGLKKGFFIGAVIFAVLGASLSSLAFFNTKERVENAEKEKFTLKETVSLIVHNKVLMIVVFSAILGSTMVMANVSASYIYNYLIDDSGIIPQNILLTVMTVAIGAGMIPPMIFLPALRKKFDLKTIYIFSSLFGIVSHVALWFFGYSNIYVLLGCFVFMGIPLGVYNVITYALIADSVDYIEWKTGKRCEGMCFAFQTFISQVSGGIATFATSVVLTVTEFKQPINDIVQQQSEFTKQGLFFMITLLPAIGFALTIIPMLFNDYTGEKKKSIQKELAERRAVNK
ncbi:MAG: MFS transporter [Clostridia bacterium]|nr:MFS transporter [Clostridia bacterium]